MYQTVVTGLSKQVHLYSDGGKQTYHPIGHKRNVQMMVHGVGHFLNSQNLAVFVIHFTVLLSPNTFMANTERTLNSAI